MTLNLKRRHKYVLIMLPIYWLAIFIATHIPRIPGWLLSNRMSDKSLHFIAFFILVYLFWNAISPYKKANWKTLKPWIVLLIFAIYGCLDEYLQGFVGRDPDPMDFVADITAAITGLIIMSIFSFWWASFVYSCICVFFITNLSHVSTLGQDIGFNAAFHFLAYALITILWIHCTSSKTEQKHILVKIGHAMLTPILFLLFVKFSAVLTGKTIYLIDIYTAASAITLSAIISSLTGLFTNQFRKSKNRSENLGIL